MATPLRPGHGRGLDPRSLASRPRCPRGPRAAPGDQQRPRWEVRGRVETGGRRKPSTRLTFSERFPPSHPGRGSRAAAATLGGRGVGAGCYPASPGPAPTPLSPVLCAGPPASALPRPEAPQRTQGCRGWRGRKKGRDRGRPGSVGGGWPARQRAPRRVHAGGRTLGDRRLSQPGGGPPQGLTPAPRV